MSDTIAALFAQVYAAPDDDAIRHVLADALIACGDPRGELIQLQLQPDADHERRAMLLLQRHGLTWLGALRDTVIPLRYERGFLASCMLVAAPAADPVEWATVHTIELNDHRLAITPAMRALRRLVGVPPRLALELANAGALAKLRVESHYVPLFEQLLSRMMPIDSIGALVLVDVPADSESRLRSLALRHPNMQLELHVRPRIVTE